MHLKILLFVLATAMFQSGASQALAGSPWQIGELEARVTFRGEVTLDSLETDWVEGSFFLVPQDDFVQSAELVDAYPSNYTISSDRFGNRYITFNWGKPKSRNLEYNLIWDVNVNRFKYAVNSSGTMGDVFSAEIEDYLKPDNLTRWTGYIREKAVSLTEGSNSTLEAVRRLAGWVSQLIYDRSYWSVSLPAEKVFEIRRGVCDELTNLFVSMSRSVGIPARYVEGLVFSGEEWDFHAWAEVYIDRWIPVDATYNEVGFADSSHIALAKVHGDNDVFNKLRWEGTDVSTHFGADDKRVDVKRVEERPLIRASLYFKDTPVLSEIINVSVPITNLANSYVVAVCTINMPQEIKLLDRREKSILIPPYGKAELFWRLAALADLDKNWLHKMPVQLFCFPAENATQIATIDPRHSKEPVADASIIELTVINESTVLVRARNDGTKELKNLTLSLCRGDETCMEKSGIMLAPGEEGNFTFEINVGEGERVYANLRSTEFEATPVEEVIRSLEGSPIVEKPNQTRIDGSIIRVEPKFGDREILELIGFIMAVLVVILSIAVLITRKR